jgi:O-antigen ligase
MAIPSLSSTSALPVTRTWLAQIRSAVVPFSVVFGIVVGVLAVVFDQPIYILAGLIGIFVFILSLYYIDFGLVVLIFTAYTRLSDILIQYHGFPSFAKPFLVVLVLSIFLRWAIFHERPNGWGYPILLFGLLSLAGFASLIYSPVPDRVFERLLDDMKDVIIAIVVIILLQSNQAFRRVIWTLIITGIFLGSLTVFQYFTGTFDNIYGGFAVSLEHQIISGVDDHRATGPMDDPNFFAQIMVVLVPISFERFLHEGKFRFRLLALWCLVVSILTIILTYSRGGLIAVLAALLVLFIVYPPKPTHVPVIIFSLAVFFFYLPPNYLERLFTLQAFFEPRNTSRLEERSLQGRLSENLTALEMIKTNPLFGVGLNSYSYLFPAYSKKLGLARVATEREAHNMFLEVVAEIGLIGFFIFSILLIAAFHSILTARNIFLAARQTDYAGMATGLFAGIFGYFVAAAFVHNAFPRFFYLLLGIAFAMDYVRRNHPMNYLSDKAY